MTGRQFQRWMLAAVSFAVLLASPETSAKDPKIAPAKVDKIEGTGTARVTLIGSASDRLGIKTAPVREVLITPRGAEAKAALRKVISYSAVIYDTNGAAWAYTSTEPLAYVRQSISIDFSQGDLTILVTGPPTGTEVVVVGAAELYGAETGVK